MRKRGLNPLKKPRWAANLQSSQKISVAQGCREAEMKLGSILLFCDNAITVIMLAISS